MSSPHPSTTSDLSESQLRWLAESGDIWAAYLKSLRSAANQIGGYESHFPISVFIDIFHANVCRSAVFKNEKWTSICTQIYGERPLDTPEGEVWSLPVKTDDRAEEIVRAVTNASVHLAGKAAGPSDESSDPDPRNGVDKDHLTNASLFIIRQYARRNIAVHSGFSDAIAASNAADAKRFFGESDKRMSQILEDQGDISMWKDALNHVYGTFFDADGKPTTAFNEAHSLKRKAEHSSAEGEEETLVAGAANDVKRRSIDKGTETEESGEKELTAQEAREELKVLTKLVESTPAVQKQAQSQMDS